MATAMSLRAVNRALRRAGCSVKATSGNHVKWICPCGQHSANIPRHVTVSVGGRSQHHQADGLPAGRVVAMKTYKVRAKRWARGWELHIEGLGVTQSHSLRDAEMMAEDYIMLDTDA